MIDVCINYLDEQCDFCLCKWWRDHYDYYDGNDDDEEEEEEDNGGDDDDDLNCNDDNNDDMTGVPKEHAQPDYGLPAGPVWEPQDYQPCVDLARQRQLHCCPPAVWHLEEGGSGDRGQARFTGCHHR